MHDPKFVQHIFATLDKLMWNEYSRERKLMNLSCINLAIILIEIIVLKNSDFFPLPICMFNLPHTSVLFYTCTKFVIFTSVAGLYRPFHGERFFLNRKP